MKAFVLVACVLVPASAYAQHFEIAPLTLFAHSSAVTIEPRAANVDDLKIDGGFVWGAAGGFVFPNGLGLELHLRRQHTGLLLTSAGRMETLFYMTAYDVDADITYQFAHSETLEPFVSGGFGSTFFSTDSISRQSFPAWNIGVGLKWYAIRHVGVRIDGRYRATFTDTGSSDYCVPFSFCQRTLSNFQIGAGAQWRF